MMTLRHVSGSQVPTFFAISNQQILVLIFVFILLYLYIVCLAGGQAREQLVMCGLVHVTVLNL